MDICDHRQVASWLYKTADLSMQKLKAAQSHMEEHGYHDQPRLDSLLEVHAKTLAAANTLLSESMETLKDEISSTPN